MTPPGGFELPKGILASATRLQSPSKRRRKSAHSTRFIAHTGFESEIQLGCKPKREAKFARPPLKCLVHAGVFRSLGAF